MQSASSAARGQLSQACQRGYTVFLKVQTPEPLSSARGKKQEVQTWVRRELFKGEVLDYWSFKACDVGTLDLRFWMIVPMVQPVHYSHRWLEIKGSLCRLPFGPVGRGVTSHDAHHRSDGRLRVRTRWYGTIGYAKASLHSILPMNRIAGCMEYEAGRYGNRHWQELQKDRSYRNLVQEETS
jgi:hypothetical protein